MSLIIVLPKIVDFIAMEDDDDDVLAIVSFFYRRSVCWSCIREIIKNLLQMDDMVRFEEWLIFSSMVGDDVIHCYGLYGGFLEMKKCVALLLRSKNKFDGR
jgi:hypothetical protein